MAVIMEAYGKLILVAVAVNISRADADSVNAVVVVEELELVIAVLVHNIYMRSSAAAAGFGSAARNESNAQTSAHRHYIGYSVNKNVSVLHALNRHVSIAPDVTAVRGSLIVSVGDDRCAQVGRVCVNPVDPVHTEVISAQIRMTRDCVH